jgi:hypothetical protein
VARWAIGRTTDLAVMLPEVLAVVAPPAVAAAATFPWSTHGQPHDGTKVKVPP